MLAQGSSAAVRDNIIALSEEFHIITPYTSLLVLETDADRVRFGERAETAERLEAERAGTPEGRMDEGRTGKLRRRATDG